MTARDVITSLQVNPSSRTAFQGFFDAQMADGCLDASLKAVVEARLALIDDLSRTTGVPDSVGELPEPGTLTATERLVVDYVDHFALHYQAIPETVWKALAEELSTAQLVELSWTIAVVKGMFRVRAALGDSVA